MAAKTFLSLFILAGASGHLRHPLEDPNLFEGDIELESGNAFANSKNNWPWPNPVPYLIDAELAKFEKAVKIIREAISDFENVTCLRFKQRTDEKGYIKFVKGGSGCSSPIGYDFAERQIKLPGWCWIKGFVQHELMHMLGFFHEQCRPDRDDYIRINWDNIDKRDWGNFQKYDRGVDTHNTPYDYDSLMHYGKKAMAKDASKNTIDTRDPLFSDRIGQRRGLSQLDIYQLNLRYQCPGFTRAPHPPTAPSFPPLASLPTQNASSRPPTTLKTVTICDYNYEQIECQDVQTVQVVSAVYGRVSKHVCSSGYVPEVVCVSDVTETVRKKLHGKKSEWLSVGPSHMGTDPCPQGPGGTKVTKYLLLQYRCV